MEPCKVCEAMYAAAASSHVIKNIGTTTDINKYCSNNHCHIHTLYSFYNTYGINGVKKLLNYSIIHLNPLSFTIAKKSELEYYKGRLIQEESNNFSLSKSLSFLKLKSARLCELLQNEKESCEIRENCLKESNKKLIEKVNEYERKCQELEDDNVSLKRKLASLSEKKEKSCSLISFNSCKPNMDSMTEEDLFQFNAFDFGFSSSEKENNDPIPFTSEADKEFLSDDDDDFLFKNSCCKDDSGVLPVVFKRQEEQRKNEEEAIQLLSDLDQGGLDDFILKVQKGEYEFKDVAASLLKQLIISDLDVVQVSIELDQFVKKCDAKKSEVLKSMAEFICKLIEKNKQKKISICAFEVIQKYFDLFQEYMGTNKKDKILFLTLLFDYCKSIKTIKPVFGNILEKLHQLNLIDASTILNWYYLQNREDLKGMIDTNENFIENLKYEAFKKNIMLKKEFDNHDDLNDSGFCSNEEEEEEMDEWLTDDEQFPTINLEVSLLDIDHSSSWDNLDTPCNCCNCNHNSNYDTSIIKDKNVGHVRFMFDSEPEIPSDHLLYESNSEDSDCYFSDYLEDDRCLLDIVDTFDEEESFSFFIQDINGEPIFSNHNILDDYCSNDFVIDNSSASSITMESQESQDFSLNNESNLDRLIIPSYISNNSFVEQESYSEEEELEKEVYILNKNYCTIDHPLGFNKERDNEIASEEIMYEEEKIDDVDIEICFETKIEQDEIENEDDKDDEDVSEDDEEIEICFEQDPNEEDEDIEIHFEQDPNEEDEDFEICFESDDENDSEESDKEEEEEEESDYEICFENNNESISSAKECDVEICFESDHDEEYVSDLEICFVNDNDEDNVSSYDDDSFESSEDEDDERIVNYKPTNSGNEMCEYISEQEKSNQRNSNKTFQGDFNSNSENESECESDSDDELEIAFEGPSDVETEIYSDESEEEEEEDSTYDTETDDDGSDTEFDDEKIEKIANLQSILPSDDYVLVDNKKQPSTFSSSSKHIDTSLNNTELTNKSQYNRNDGISSDLDEIMYDSDIDIVFCSSDCTIEISDDQSEMNYCKDVNNSYNSSAATATNNDIDSHQSSNSSCLIEDTNSCETEEENNSSLYIDFQRIKEDGQKKYLNKNIKKKYSSINKDIHKLLKCYLTKPEIKYEIEELIGKYSVPDSEITSNLVDYTRKMKKNLKKSKKHSIKNGNFLNKSTLRNIN